jgi:hypothetical protein
LKPINQEININSIALVFNIGHESVMGYVV